MSSPRPQKMISRRRFFALPQKRAPPALASSRLRPFPRPEFIFFALYIDYIPKKFVVNVNIVCRNTAQGSDENPFLPENKGISAFSAFVAPLSPAFHKNVKNTPLAP